MIVFPCVECGMSLQALDENAGKKARCQCGAISRIPATSFADQAPAYPPPSYPPPESTARSASPSFDQIEEGDRFRRQESSLDPGYDPDLDPGFATTPSNTASPDSSTAANPYAAPDAPPAPVAPADEGSGLSAVLWGIVLMVLSVIWFFGGLAAGRIFIYPPILFFVGLFKLIGGLTRR